MLDSRWLRPLYVGAALVILGLFLLVAQHASTSRNQISSTFIDGVLGKTWEFSYPRDAENYGLSDTQCSTAFPKLFDEIDRAKKDRNGTRVTFEDIDKIRVLKGYLRAMIYDHQLYVLKDSDAVYSRSFAVLLALHRAIITRPAGTSLPNIEFVLNVDDRHASAPMWTFTRNSSDNLAWLMPDFGFWSWPETKVGSYGEVVHGIHAMEDSDFDNPTGKRWDWDSKHPQVFWRGASMDLEHRLGLLAHTNGKHWADVKSLDWTNELSMKQDLKTMPEHCQYKFVAHTEGNSYSGRLKYLQNCRSVIISHPQQWVTHVSHLMNSTPGSSTQNYVEVTHNFSSLESRIHYLLENDAYAARIAAHSVRIFRERYLTPAAETCYWRRLISEWRDNSFEPELFEVVAYESGVARTQGRRIRGVPFETYILERRMSWEPY